MSRIAQAFKKASEESRVALIPYLMTGYPRSGLEGRIADALERGGADLIEIGMPFSDPVADGPTIQHASTVSLRNGTTMRTCLETAGTIRKSTDLPLVLMGYYNPVLRYGVDKFFFDAASAGVDGLIVPDLPPDEAADLCVAARHFAIDPIFLVAPTSTEGRLQIASQVAQGFLYCVSLTGVTGARETIAAGLADFLARVRSHTDLPLAVGFGISTPDHVRGVAQVADGVVFASALLNLIAQMDESEMEEQIRCYVESLMAASKKPVTVGDITHKEDD